MRNGKFGKFIDFTISPSQMDIQVARQFAPQVPAVGECSPPVKTNQFDGNWWQPSKKKCVVINEKGNYHWTNHQVINQTNEKKKLSTLFPCLSQDSLPDWWIKPRGSNKAICDMFALDFPQPTKGQLRISATWNYTLGIYHIICIYIYICINICAWYCTHIYQMKSYIYMSYNVLYMFFLLIMHILYIYIYTYAHLLIYSFIYLLHIHYIMYVVQMYICICMYMKMYL